MNWIIQILVIASAIAIALFLLTLTVLAFGWSGLLLVFVLLAIYGWMLFAFINYRYCRQEEFLHVLAAAAEHHLPLAEAIRAYLRERLAGDMKEFWTASLLAVFPIPLYYWVWHRRRRFDVRIARVASLLERGMTLYAALEKTPGLASREMMLAVAIGETTGRLSQCLRQNIHKRVGTVWIELLPYLVYPATMLLLIWSITGFLLYFIVPKFRRIFSDFGVDLPDYTVAFLMACDWVVEFFPYIAIGVAILGGLTLIVTINSTARWFIPGLGWLYRRTSQSRVMRFLSLLLQTGRPVPQALALMTELPFGLAVQRRLLGAKCRIERGEPLAECLLEVGLLPNHMYPLVRMSERTGTLPWVLTELGNALFDRTLRAVQRIGQAITPVMVMSFGAVVATIVCVVFLPFVKLITEMSR